MLYSTLPACAFLHNVQWEHDAMFSDTLNIMIMSLLHDGNVLVVLEVFPVWFCSIGGYV